MPIPWLVHVGAAAGLIPPLAVLLLRRRPRGAAAWILAWVVLLIVEDALAAVLGALGLNNHWVNYL
ncbi:MAG: hypothetical protein HY561_05245, partial [Gemmatimonadetes bacterium]|nr:hypothetical protein [Gemmatimonadota bacterium]